MMFTVPVSDEVREGLCCSFVPREKGLSYAWSDIGVWILKLARMSTSGVDMGPKNKSAFEVRGFSRPKKIYD